MKPDKIPEAKATILGMFKKTHRPVLIGQASLELRWPLSWVEKLFEELLDERKIRPVTKAEASEYDVSYAFFLQK